MIVIFLGAPGSGKGTQASRVAKEMNLKALSTGNLLRSEIASETKLGKEIKSIVNNGKLVEDHIVLKLIEENIARASNNKGFILDGFPRTIMQAKMLSSLLKNIGKEVDFVIELDVQQELLIKRLTSRYECKECGAGYNKLYKNPIKDGVCDICGGEEFIVRSDDSEEVINRRFKEYKNLTEPLLPYYNAQGSLYKVDGNQAPESIFGEITNILKNVLT